MRLPPGPAVAQSSVTGRIRPGEGRRGGGGGQRNCGWIQGGGMFLSTSLDIWFIQDDGRFCRERGEGGRVSSIGKWVTVQEWGGEGGDINYIENNNACSPIPNQNTHKIVETKQNMESYIHDLYSWKTK